MKTSVILSGCFAFALAFAASAPGPASAASGRITFKVADETRSAVVTERYRSKRKLRPAIIVLRDQGRGVLGAPPRELRFREFARKGGVLVYADAPGGWKLGPAGDAAAEVAYLRALVQHLRTASRADPRRIYLVGVGAGGVVALQAACTDSRLFAGVAAGLASLPPESVARCSPAQPVSTLLIAGDADKRAPFAGGTADLAGFSGLLAPVADVAGVFARAAGCGPRTLRSDVPDRDRADGTRVTLERYAGCKARVQVVRVLGGGHFMPTLTTAAPRTPGQNRDIGSAGLILSFFQL